MLLKIYKNLKATLNTIGSINHIGWFNDQYSGTIHTTPAIFIEFPNALQFETMSKDLAQAALTVRIHIVNKAVSAQDGEISEGVLLSHENLNSFIYGSLQGLSQYDAGLEVHNSLNRVTYEHHQYMKGWLVTTQDFEAEIYQHNEITTLETKPKAEIGFL